MKCELQCDVLSSPTHSTIGIILHTLISSLVFIISGAGLREFNFLRCDLFGVLTTIVTTQGIKIENEIEHNSGSLW